MSMDFWNYTNEDSKVTKGLNFSRFSRCTNDDKDSEFKDKHHNNSDKVHDDAAGTQNWHFPGDEDKKKQNNTKQW